MSRLLTNTPILIRRYARNRLSNAAHERSVSLDTLRAWKAKAMSFIVQDAETGKDVTRVLLA